MITIEDIRGIRDAALVNVKFSKAKRVSTDSRSVSRGEVFFALRGEKFDGHRFVSASLRKGAACAVVDRKWYRHNKPSAVHSLVVVDDTSLALGELARIYRRKFDMPVIAIGGSNGKTTTKEMTARVLGMKYKVARTEGNHNNQIGVPLTILGFNKLHEAAVVEIGTNHFGEISRLCEILEPNAGLITNIGNEHLEFFRNIAGVAREEGKLFGFLARTNGLAFVNMDDTRAAGPAGLVRHRFRYGFQPGSRRNVAGRLFGFDSRGCAVFEIKFEGRTELVHMNVPGIHGAMNALAAAAVGLRYGIPHREVREALESFRSYDKRMQVIRKAGVTILNDTYNSNPESVVAALRWMSTVRTHGKRIAVLADMLELGGASRREHEKIGCEVVRQNVDRVFTFGRMARHTARAVRDKVETESFDDKRKLSKRLLQTVSAGDVVVVKGSRGMKMEEIVEALLGGLKAGGKS